MEGPDWRQRVPFVTAASLVPREGPLPVGESGAGLKVDGILRDRTLDQAEGRNGTLLATVTVGLAPNGTDVMGEVMI